MARIAHVAPCMHSVVILCVFAVTLVSVVGAQDAKGASVSLLAKWPGTSLVLETTEFMVCLLNPRRGLPEPQAEHLMLCCWSRQPGISQLSGTSYTILPSPSMQQRCHAGQPSAKMLQHSSRQALLVSYSRLSALASSQPK